MPAEPNLADRFQIAFSPGNTTIVGNAPPVNMTDTSHDANWCITLAGSTDGADMSINIEVPTDAPSPAITLTGSIEGGDLSFTVTDSPDSPLPSITIAGLSSSGDLAITSTDACINIGDIYISGNVSISVTASVGNLGAGTVVNASSGSVVVSPGATITVAGSTDGTGPSISVTNSPPAASEEPAPADPAPASGGGGSLSAPFLLAMLTLYGLRRRSRA